jgi:hypothetical protein
MMATATTAERADFMPANRGRHSLLALLGSLARFAVGVILCLTPVTAILVLGWLVRLMQREEEYVRKRLQGATGGEHAPRLLNWIMVETPTSATLLTRWLGSLVGNLRQAHCCRQASWV